MNKKLFNFFLICVCTFSFACHAESIEKNTAKMQAMDKITGRVSVIYVPVGGAVDFGSLSIAVRSCKTRPAEETPDNFVFADIADKTLQGENVNIFRGWMISSSPATNAVEHPIFDVWLLQCLDKKVDKNLLLSDEQFSERETYRMVRNTAPVTKILEPDPNTAQSQQIQEMNEEDHPQNQLLPTIEFSYDEAEETEEEMPKDDNSVETSEETDNPTTDAEIRQNEIISILPPEDSQDITQ